jgi:hypothetical protein
MMAIKNKDRFAVAFNPDRGGINVTTHNLGTIERALRQNPMVVIEVQSLLINVLVTFCLTETGVSAEFERFPESILKDAIRPRHHCIGRTMFEGEVFWDFGKDGHLYSFG